MHVMHMQAAALSFSQHLEIDDGQHFAGNWAGRI
jgi:hypothetical protein